MWQPYYFRNVPIVRQDATGKVDTSSKDIPKQSDDLNATTEDMNKECENTFPKNACEIPGDLKNMNFQVGIEVEKTTKGMKLSLDISQTTIEKVVSYFMKAMPLQKDGETFRTNKVGDLGETVNEKELFKSSIDTQNCNEREYKNSNSVSVNLPLSTHRSELNHTGKSTVTDEFETTEKVVEEKTVSTASLRVLPQENDTNVSIPTVSEIKDVNESIDCVLPCAAETQLNQSMSHKEPSSKIFTVLTETPSEKMHENIKIKQITGNKVSEELETTVSHIALYSHISSDEGLISENILSSTDNLNNSCTLIDNLNIKPNERACISDLVPINEFSGDKQIEEQNLKDTESIRVSPKSTTSLPHTSKFVTIASETQENKSLPQISNLAHCHDIKTRNFEEGNVSNSEFQNTTDIQPKNLFAENNATSCCELDEIDRLHSLDKLTVENELKRNDTESESTYIILSTDDSEENVAPDKLIAQATKVVNLYGTVKDSGGSGQNNIGSGRGSPEKHQQIFKKDSSDINCDLEPNSINISKNCLPISSLEIYTTNDTKLSKEAFVSQDVLDSIISNISIENDSVYSSEATSEHESVHIKEPMKISNETSDVLDFYIPHDEHSTSQNTSASIVPLKACIDSHVEIKTESEHIREHVGMTSTASDDSGYNADTLCCKDKFKEDTVNICSKNDTTDLQENLEAFSEKNAKIKESVKSKEILSQNLTSAKEVKRVSDSECLLTSKGISMKNKTLLEKQSSLNLELSSTDVDIYSNVSKNTVTVDVENGPNILLGLHLEKNNSIFNETSSAGMNEYGQNNEVRDDSNANKIVSSENLVLEKVQNVVQNGLSDSESNTKLNKSVEENISEPTKRNSFNYKLSPKMSDQNKIAALKQLELPENHSTKSSLTLENRSSCKLSENSLDKSLDSNSKKAEKLELFSDENIVNSRLGSSKKSVIGKNILENENVQQIITKYEKITKRTESFSGIKTGSSFCEPEVPNKSPKSIPNSSFGKKSACEKDTSLSEDSVKLTCCKKNLNVKEVKVRESIDFNISKDVSELEPSSSEKSDVFVNGRSMQLSPISTNDLIRHVEKTPINLDFQPSDKKADHEFENSIKISQLSNTSCEFNEKEENKSLNADSIVVSSLDFQPSDKKADHEFENSIKISQLSNTSCEFNEKEEDKSLNADSIVVSSLDPQSSDKAEVLVSQDLNSFLKISKCDQNLLNEKLVEDELTNSNNSTEVFSLDAQSSDDTCHHSLSEDSIKVLLSSTINSCEQKEGHLVDKSMSLNCSIDSLNSNSLSHDKKAEISQESTKILPIFDNYDSHKNEKEDKKLSLDSRLSDKNAEASLNEDAIKISHISENISSQLNETETEISSNQSNHSANDSDWKLNLSEKNLDILPNQSMKLAQTSIISCESHEQQTMDASINLTNDTDNSCLKPESLDENSGHAQCEGRDNFAENVLVSDEKSDFIEEQVEVKSFKLQNSIQIITPVRETIIAEENDLNSTSNVNNKSNTLLGSFDFQEDGKNISINECVSGCDETDAAPTRNRIFPVTEMSEILEENEDSELNAQLPASSTKKPTKVTNSIRNSRDLTAKRNERCKSEEPIGNPNKLKAKTIQGRRCSETMTRRMSNEIPTKKDLRPKRGSPSTVTKKDMDSHLNPQKHLRKTGSLQETTDTRLTRSKLKGTAYSSESESSNLNAENISTPVKQRGRPKKGASVEIKNGSSDSLEKVSEEANNETATPSKRNRTKLTTPAVKQTSMEKSSHPGTPSTRAKTKFADSESKTAVSATRKTRKTGKET